MKNPVSSRWEPRAFRFRWISSVASAAEGDVNGDGIVDSIDLNSVGLWWLQQADDFASSGEAQASSLLVAQAANAVGQQRTPKLRHLILRRPASRNRSPQGVTETSPSLGHDGAKVSDLLQALSDEPVREFPGRRYRRLQLDQDDSDAEINTRVFEWRLRWEHSKCRSSYAGKPYGVDKLTDVPFGGFSVVLRAEYLAFRYHEYALGTRLTTEKPVDATAPQKMPSHRIS